MSEQLNKERDEMMEEIGKELAEEMSEVEGEIKKELKELEQEGLATPKIVTPDMLLNQIVSKIGPDFVVISMSGWGKIVETIHDANDGELLKELEKLNVPVIPVSLTPKEKESRIIVPTDTPQGDSKIIL